MPPDSKADGPSVNAPRAPEPAEPSQREEALAVFAKVGYDLERHPAHVVRRVHQRATSCFQQVMAGETLSPTQFAALATILKHGEISQNHLGRLTAMDPSTTSLVVRKLVKDGLISRSASKSDQRLAIIRLTDAGLRYTAERLERSLEVGRRLLSPLKPSEQKVFLALLERIASDETPL